MVQLMSLHPKTSSSLALYNIKSRLVSHFLVPAYPGYSGINIKNCSLSIVLTATDQKPQKSLKGDIIHHHIA